MSPEHAILDDTVVEPRRPPGLSRRGFKHRNRQRRQGRPYWVTLSWCLVGPIGLSRLGFGTRHRQRRPDRPSWATLSRSSVGSRLVPARLRISPSALSPEPTRPGDTVAGGAWTCLIRPGFAPKPAIDKIARTDPSARHLSWSSAGAPRSVPA